MTQDSDFSINTLGQEVYSKLLEQARNTGAFKDKQIPVAQNIKKKGKVLGILKEYGGKTIFPAAVLFSAIALLYATNNTEPAIGKSITKEPQAEQSSNNNEDSQLLRAMAQTDFDKLTKQVDNNAVAAKLGKMNKQIYTKYQIEKGLSLYNPNLTPNELSSLSSAILKASEQFDLPPDLITGIVITESRGRTRSKSWAGAYGPMQVMYSVHGKTLKKFGVNKAEDLYNTEKGIMSGSWIFKGYLERNKHNVKRALSRYYGANSPAYYNGTLRRAATVRNVKVPDNIAEPLNVLKNLDLDKDQTELFYRMVYASTLGDGLTLKKAAAWLSADSPELLDNEKIEMLAILKYFGNGDNGQALNFPAEMKAIALDQMKRNGEEEYLKEIGGNLLLAHVMATDHNINHGLFLACAQRAQDRIKAVNDNPESDVAYNRNHYTAEDYYYEL